MDYKECLDYIHSIPKLSKKLGHDNIRYALSLLGNPQDKLSFIHIAGTNGKGSTASYIASSLTCAGYKTGKFISPFIQSFNERISIDHINIDDGSLVRITSLVKETLEKMSEKTGRTLSEFEVVTVIGFLYFAEQSCDFVVLETGLGGRLDATNVIKTPLVSVLTKIDLDHTRYLGGTISEIAFEKCGIIKSGCPVVSYPVQTKEAKEIIKEQAAQNKSPLYIADMPKIHSQSLSGNVFDYKDMYGIKTSLLGEYQILNAATAIETLFVLRSYYPVLIEDTHIKKGLLLARNTGRFEALPTNPVMILDGAHNPDGISSFIHSIKQYAIGKKLIAVMGMMADKDYGKCVRIVSENVDFLIATPIADVRSAEPAALLKYADIRCQTAPFGSFTDAIGYARKIADDNSVILVVGSLYLIGEALLAANEWLETGSDKFED